MQGLCDVQTHHGAVPRASAHSQHQGHNFQPTSSLPVPYAGAIGQTFPQHGQHMLSNSGPGAYGYYTPPYMVNQHFTPSPNSAATFAAPYQPHGAAAGGSLLSRGGGSLFTPVVGNTGKSRSLIAVGPNTSIMYGKQNSAVVNSRFNGGVSSNSNGNSDARQAVASQRNKDLLTEL